MIQKLLACFSYFCSLQNQGTLLSVIAIMKHLEFNNILPDTQFGFKSLHSCETQLLITIDGLARALNNKLQIDCGILDFAKAFDKMPHLRLLEFYSIRGH